MKRIRLVCSWVLALTVLDGCSSDPSEPTGRTAVGDVSQPLEPAVIDAVGFFHVLRAGATLEDVESGGLGVLPVVSFAGEAVFNLAFSSPKPFKDALPYVATLEQKDADSIKLAFVGATREQHPSSIRAPHGDLLVRIGKTVRAIGIDSVKRLVAPAHGIVLVQDTAGRLYSPGSEAPLSESELAQVWAIRDRHDKSAADPALRPSMRARWADLLPKDQDAVAALTDARGRLDLRKAIAQLRASGYTSSAKTLTPAEAEGLAPAPVGARGDNARLAPKDIAVGGQRCAHWFLWWCTDVGTEEVGAYAPECSGLANATGIVNGARNDSTRACQSGNLRSNAVAHVETSHAYKGMYGFFGAASGDGPYDVRYSGCGPESFATMVWRRWVNGDDDFGYDRAALTPTPSYLSGDWTCTTTGCTSANGIMAKAANGAVVPMGTFFAGNGQAATWDWNYEPGANAWLASRGSPLRIASNWGILGANSAPPNVVERARVLHELVGKGRGPVVAGCNVGGAFIYHYAPVFAYRILRDSSNVPVDIVVSIDYPTPGDPGHAARPYEVAITDGWLLAAGLWYFADQATPSAQ